MMDSTNVSLSYDLESNQTYQVLVETHSNDGDTRLLESNRPFLQENTCFENKWYYATYVSISIIFVIIFVLLYAFYF